MSNSRFSVLCPEVDLDSYRRVKPKSIKEKGSKVVNGCVVKKVENKPVKSAVKLNEKSQNKCSNQNNSNHLKKKKNGSELQALAFGFGKTKGCKKREENNSADKEKLQKNKKGKLDQAANETDILQDDDWRKRDEEFIKVQNEESLREAIMQSKLDFEEQKKKDKCLILEQEKEESQALKKTKTKKKKDKPITISLDEFNSLEAKDLANLRESLPSINNNNNLKEEVDSKKFNEEKFFKDVEEATKKTLEKEYHLEQYKANVNKVNQEIQIKKFISEIEKRDFEIQALRLEVDSLNNKLLAVKTRNKKLCEIISFSEMRSKGELVIELEKVTRGRDEFSQEIAKIMAELEQERTKVSQLNVELKKLQGKKRNMDSSGK